MQSIDELNNARILKRS